MGWSRVVQSNVIPMINLTAAMCGDIVPDRPLPWIQVHSAMGLMDNLPQERVWRDVHLEQIRESASELPV